ncbi:hypothetical protein PVAP13_7NG208817 [Panicum virgatum]|uniref:Receptor-like serine/threonine-protein kinase n=1 Tax=Panicum virgatum TaxID=38727 RepID=A0A8T0PUS6_PANVG|nr:hypothetical protein PVAP13_7NG208817 [Panicum virgatum]
MALVLVVLVLVLVSSPSRAASARDTISPGETLGGSDELVSSNGKYKLGFFPTGSESPRNASNYWYLGIWFNRVPTMTPVWVANGDDPIADLTTAVLTISPDGNLVVGNPVTGSIIWSTQANVTTNNTIATLFDHPTSSLLPDAKLGWDKVAGLNRRLVSRKNSADQAPGSYSLELDPSGAAQFILVELNSGITYWSSGVWNGRFFYSIPDMGADSEFINNGREVYFISPMRDANVVARLSLEVSGQIKSFIWYEQLQYWVTAAVQPKSQCEVYALCGPYAVCNDNVIPSCNCMEGFSIKSLKDWELEDRTGGCIRNNPLDSSCNKTTGSTDGFYSIPCFRLPQNPQNTTGVLNEGECAHACLSSCSCTAYSFGDYGCYVWHDELLNVKDQQYSDLTSTKVEILKVRLAAKELIRWKNHRRKMLVWVVTSTSVALFGHVLLLMIWRNKKKQYFCTINNIQDLKHATKSFSSKLRSGGFGSVYKGVLADSTAIAVKMLDGFSQGEKQFRAEVSSIGITQHGNKRLLVYEYLPYHSLDAHLFQTSVTFLNWKTRYQVALGVARGQAYLHESCREYIIHCDIKPQNILLDASFTPKIADFGMAKFMQRDFSRALTTMRGTIGYLAPEWLSGVAITTKIDITTFLVVYGMLLFEIISGSRNTSEQCSSCADNDVYFPLQVANGILKGDVQGLVDPKVCGDVNLEEVERVCKIACWCIQDKDSDRPAMGEVVQILEGLREVDVPPLPKILQAVAGSPH